MPLLNRVNSPAATRAAATTALLALACLGIALDAVVRCSAASADDDAAGKMPGTRLRIVTVDQSGKGDHRRIQDAIDAAPANGAVVIRIRPGVYRQVE